MPTANDFRRIALGMTGATEGSHMAHPDFRANGRIFATIYPDPRRGMVRLTPDQQVEFVRASPAAFEPASGAWGRQGCTTVRLDAVDETTLGEAMTLAWQNAVRQSAVKRRSAVKKKTIKKSGVKKRADKKKRVARRPRVRR